MTVIAEIRELRTFPPGDPRRGAVDDAVAVVYDFIDSKHAHVQLRIRVIARELGIAVKTLERRFEARYGTKIQQRLSYVRLEFAKSLLGFYPETQIGDIAHKLGYTDVRNFNRFFQDQMHMSPSEWCQRDQAITERRIRRIRREADRSVD